jgi:hypothetical protein
MGLIAQRTVRTGQAGGILPIGRYWIDLFGSKEYRDCLAECYETSKLLGPAYYYSCKAKCYVYPGGADAGIDAFNQWGNANSTSVKKLREEEFSEVLTGKFAPPRKWVLFELINPVEWPETLRLRLGVPTPAGPEVSTSDDTVKKPPPEKGPLEPGGFFDEAKPWIIGGGVLISLALVVGLVRR